MIVCFQWDGVGWGGENVFDVTQHSPSLGLVSSLSPPHILSVSAQVVSLGPTQPVLGEQKKNNIGFALFKVAHL